VSRSIIDVLADEYVEPSAHIKAVCEDISAHHPGRVQAFIYYGSSLRDMVDPDKMLDLYVIVDSYRKTHKNLLRALLNAVIPPAVYYHEMDHGNGVTTTCKYSIISFRAFERRCGTGAFLSVIWGRFSQPCVILFPNDETVNMRLLKAREAAVKRMANQTVSLFDKPVDAITFWARAFRESYRTELRPEGSDERSREIVVRYGNRYKALMSALFDQPDDKGLYTLPRGGLQFTKLKWFGRRWLGKLAGAVRVLNSALTFSGGFDYIESKLYRHSGVKIAVTEHQRRHPLLWSPILAWKYWRAGAFR